MCSLPPFPSLPTFSWCFTIAKLQYCSPAIPNPAALPIWAVQVVLWALIEVPLGELACALSGFLTGLTTDINGGLTSLSSILSTFFADLQGTVAWTGIWAPVAAAVIVGSFIFGVLVLILWVVDALEDAEHLAVELA